jgi:hypothetical protein
LSAVTPTGVTAARTTTITTRTRLSLWLVHLLPAQARHLARDLAAATRVLLPRIGSDAFARVRPPLHRLTAAGRAG